MSDATKEAEPPAKPKKIGRPSLETLSGVKRTMARVIVGMRLGTRNTKIGGRVVDSLYKLAKVIEAERKSATGLDHVSDEVLIDEVRRRARSRLGSRAPVAGGEPEAPAH